MTSRTAPDRSEEDRYANERLETYAYDALGLIDQFTVKSQQARVSVDGDCGLSASNAPMHDWRYRFSPMSEREQKRQYAHFSDSNALAWTYYMLGADAKQLSTWNGIEGDHCAETNTVCLWPVERNGFGPANTRIIIRQDSTREFVITDHLGSIRLVINSNKDKLEEHNYEPFGGTIKHEGIAARTSYIGRETDTESDLSMHGVRQYSQEYGRFSTTDPAWTMYEGYTPFHYALNSPILLFDHGGKWVQAVSKEAQTAIRNSLPGDLGCKISFNPDGFINRDKLRALAEGDGTSSNLDALSWLADRDETIQVEVVKSFDVKLYGKATQQTFYTAAPGESLIDATLTVKAGIAVIDKKSTGDPKSLPTSSDGLIKVFVNKSVGTGAVQNEVTSSKGEVVAHELYAHIFLALQRRAGLSRIGPWHTKNNKSSPELKKIIDNAVNEAGKAEGCDNR